MLNRLGCSVAMRGKSTRLLVLAAVEKTIIHATASMSEVDLTERLLDNHAEQAALHCGIITALNKEVEDVVTTNKEHQVPVLIQE